MTRTRAERRAFAKRAEKRTKSLMNRWGWHNESWWRIADGINKREGGDTGMFVNGRWKERPGGGVKISRNGQHVVVERTTEKSIVLRAEFESHI